MTWLNLMWNWLEGKKTYLAAVALVILGILLIFAGENGTGMEAVLLGAAVAGLGDRANRHQAEILATIQDLGKLAADARSKAPAIALDDAVKVIGDALQLKSAAQAETIGSGSDASQESH